MLTARGGWFLAAIVLVLVVGAFIVPYYSVVPALLAITLLVWFAFEWAQFQTRSNAAIARLRVTRHILQGGREVPMLWSGIPFEVRVTVENPSAVGIPFAVLEDRGAVASQHVSGASRVFTELGAGEQVEIVLALRGREGAGRGHAGVLLSAGVSARSGRVSRPASLDR